VHIRATHMGLKPHVCTVEGCGQAYGHKHLLVRHMRTHNRDTVEDERPRKRARKDVTDALLGGMSNVNIDELADADIGSDRPLQSESS
jgi:hypothetical protein